MKLELLFTRIYENFPCSPLLLIFPLVLSCGGQAWGQGEFSDGFDRVANSGPYRDWKSIAEANESWAQARACVSQDVDDSSATIVAHDHPDSSAEGADGGAHLTSGANGQLALLYRNQELGDGNPFELGVTVEALGVEQRGGLVFRWDPLEGEGEPVSTYLFQLFNGDANASGANLAVRLAKYEKEAGDGRGLAPMPAAVLMGWTDLPGFDPLPTSIGVENDEAVRLRVTSRDGRSFELTATQGEKTWSTTVEDSGVPLAGGYAGFAIQRGNGVGEGDGNFGQGRFDDFSLVLPSR